MLVLVMFNVQSRYIRTHYAYLYSKFNENLFYQQRPTKYVEYENMY